MIVVSEQEAVAVPFPVAAEDLEAELVAERLGFSDLTAVDSDAKGVRERFEKEFEKRPNGVCVNDETAFDSIRPAPTQRYRLWCDKIGGAAVLGPQTAGSKSTQILGRNTATNRSDRDAEVTLEVSGSWSHTVSWSYTSTAGLKLSSKIKISAFFEAGGEVSFATTVGEAGSHTTSQQAKASVRVTVPPRSRQTIRLVGTAVEQRRRFKIPVSIHGWFGANFAEPVRGHYIWFLSAPAVLPRISGNWEGEITSAVVFDTRTEIDPAEPIGD